MEPRGAIVQKILAALQEHGPMSRAEICEALCIDRTHASAVITRMSRATPRCSKRIYICSYVHHHDGARRYPRAVYDLGDKPDARKPKSKPGEAQKRYREKLSGFRNMNSVFNLGTPRRQLLECGLYKLGANHGPKQNRI